MYCLCYDISVNSYVHICNLSIMYSIFSDFSEFWAVLSPVHAADYEQNIYQGKCRHCLGILIALC